MSTKTKNPFFSIQNIPVRTKLGRKLRCSIHSTEKGMVLNIDWKRLENKVVARSHKDEK